MLLLSSMALSYKIVDSDTAVVNWDGGSPAATGEAITNGGWTLFQGADEFDYTESAGNGYGGSDWYIETNYNSNLIYRYTNSSLNTQHIKYLTYLFYDDATDTSVNDLTFIPEYGNYFYIGIDTDESTTNYSYWVNDDASLYTTPVARTTGWHNATFYWNDSDNKIYGWIDGVKLSRSNTQPTSADNGVSRTQINQNGNSCGNCRIGRVYFWNETEAIPGPSNFSVSAYQLDNGVPLSNLSVEIVGQGTYTTTNYTVVTPFLSNATSLYTVIVSSTQDGGYFSRTYSNRNMSNDLNSSMYQAIVNMTAYELYTNDYISGGTYNVGSQTNQTLYLSAGSHTVTFSNASYYDKSGTITVSALDDVTRSITGVYDTVLNVTGRDQNTGDFLSTFTSQASIGAFEVSNTTSSGQILFNLIKNVGYNVTMDALGYTLEYATVTPNASTAHYTFDATKVNTISIEIRDEETNSLILENVSMRFSTNSSEEDYFTSNGTFFLEDQTPAEYLISFNSSGNYSYRTYAVTLDNRSTLSLTAYLASGTSNTLFTVSDDSSDVAIENVLATMYRFINGSWQAVESKYTDITGKAQFSYKPYTNYKFFLGKTDYDDYVFYLNPILFSEYDIKMTKSTQIDYESDFDGLAVIYSPTIFAEGNNSFNFIISSPGGTLVNYGYTLTYPGGTSSTSGSNAIGGQLNVDFTISNATVWDEVQLYYYYTSTIGGSKNYTFNFPIQVQENYNQTFLSNRDNTYGLGIFERVFVATLIVIFVVGIATLVGQPIAGFAVGLFIFGYMVYIGFIPIWAILISMFIGGVFLMWKSGG